MTDPDLARRHERWARALAIPLALAFAWVARTTMPAVVRMLTMWVHETGHATAAWLSGYSAWPGPWFTPISSERNASLTLALVVFLVSAMWRAWRVGRWFWVLASAVTTLTVAWGTGWLTASQAEQFIFFAGDGGCFVLGTALMLSVYARDEHPVRRDGLRWGLVVFGALAFVDALVVWSGPIDSLPLGENDNGLSDPTVLTEVYGWTLPLVMERYARLAQASGLVVAAVYVLGLLDLAAPAAAEPADRRFEPWGAHVHPRRGLR